MKTHSERYQIRYRLLIAVFCLSVMSMLAAGFVQQQVAIGGPYQV